MKKALVNGSARGIGLELVKQLTADYEVTALCRKASDELKNLNVKIIENVDVSDNNALKQCVQSLEDKYDLFINNAGVWSNETLDHVDCAVIMRDFQINSVAPLYLCSLLFTENKFNAGAKIGLMSSRMGSIADNDSGGRYGYRMSKAALNAAGKSLAIDFAPHDISVAILHPGYVRTDMTDGKGDLNPDQAVTGLLSVMQSLSLQNSGKFWHSNGSHLEW